MDSRRKNRYRRSLEEQPSRRDFIQVGSRHLAAIGVAGLSAKSTRSFSMLREEIQIRDFRLWLSQPRVVAEATSGRCWYPSLEKFSTGELMLNHSLNADVNINPTNTQAVYVSTDKGLNFDFAYDVNGFHNGCGEPRISLPDGRIVGTSTFLKPDPAGQHRRFSAHRWTYDRGGKRYTVEPWGAVVEGLPRDVEPWPQESRTWWARINWFSDILKLDQYVATISVRFQGDARWGTVAVASDDGGRHWRYLSTIAGPDSVPDAKEGFDEPCLVQLADGDLMCVSRVGAGKDQNLARAYSADGGKSWSRVDRLPAYSVAPQMVRLANGALTLVTGRPGLFLWISGDSRGQKWESVDLMAHHNRTVPSSFQMNAKQTSAYIDVIEVSPNRVFLVYDRTPFGWEPVPADSSERSRIYLLEAEIERV